MLAGFLIGVTLTGAVNIAVLKHLHNKHRREFDKKIEQHFKGARRLVKVKNQ